MDIKVEGHPDLVRRGGSIVNVDRQAFLSYIENRNLEKKKQQRVDDLESELAELKKLVQSLLRAKK